MHFLTKDLYFPDPRQTDRYGLLAIGGDLSPERLMLAYRSGIFPWFDADEPILWWCPPQRMVLYFDELKISKSMRQLMRKRQYTITFDKAFTQVISHCQKTGRKGQDGTWITGEMEQAYNELHRLGHAHSVEVWRDETLVGGLYGVDIGRVFCGESMFSLESNTSKLAFFALAAALQSKGYALLDCQVYNDHLSSLGCRTIPRDQFLGVIGENKG